LRDSEPRKKYFWENSNGIIGNISVGKRLQ
jgi:hypothetical protein